MSLDLLHTHIQVDQSGTVVQHTSFPSQTKYMIINDIHTITSYTADVDPIQQTPRINSALTSSENLDLSTAELKVAMIATLMAKTGE